MRAGPSRRPILAHFPGMSVVVERGSREIDGGWQHQLFLSADGEHIPAILLLPGGRKPVPAALLLHGLGSRKERMAETAGRALLRHGVASLSIDLPLHGEREGEVEDLASRNPFELVRRWRVALAEARVAVRFLAAHPRVDPTRVALVGYSLGSFIAVEAASGEPAVGAVFLVAGGDLPGNIPFATLIRTVVDPPRAVRRIAGRPLLMLNGRADQRIRPAQADRLFEAAREPKEIRWYGGGHRPPESEVEAGVEWLVRVLRAPRRRTAGGAKTG
jgi:uncharacterized protein